MWLLYSIVDHYIVWDQFPVWYHLLYLAYIAPLALLGAKLVKHKIDHANIETAVKEGAA